MAVLDVRLWAWCRTCRGGAIARPSSAARPHASRARKTVRVSKNGAAMGKGAGRVKLSGPFADRRCSAPASNFGSRSTLSRKGLGSFGGSSRPAVGVERSAVVDPSLPRRRSGPWRAGCRRTHERARIEYDIL